MNIIRTESEGIEFFTVAATGESGSSQSGLAILTGVSQASISRRHLKSLVSNAGTQYSIDGNLCGNLVLLDLQFCIDIIRHHARKGSPIAQASLEKILIVDSPFRVAVLAGKINLLPINSPKERSNPENLYVFLDRERQVCKIGRSSNVFKRLKATQTNYPYRLAVHSIEEGKGYLEREIHYLLSDFRLNGEWFDSECLSLLEDILRQETVEQKIENLEQLAHQHDGEVDRIFHPDGKFFSIRGWAKLQKIKVSKQEAANLGRQATKASKSLGVEIDKLEDPRYGEVNIYHEVILRQVFEMEEE